MGRFSRPVTANWDFDCEECGNKVFEGDTFYYHNDEKICKDCKEDIERKEMLF